MGSNKFEYLIVNSEIKKGAAQTPLSTRQTRIWSGGISTRTGTQSGENITWNEWAPVGIDAETLTRQLTEKLIINPTGAEKQTPYKWLDYSPIYVKKISFAQEVTNDRIIVSSPLGDEVIITKVEGYASMKSDGTRLFLPYHQPEGRNISISQTGDGLKTEIAWDTTDSLTFYLDVYYRKPAPEEPTPTPEPSTPTPTPTPTPEPEGTPGPDE
jgi:hypothetical protein